MPLPERLRSFLDSHHAEYTFTTHPKAFTAREVAVAEHLPPREVAKTVVILGDGAHYIIVIPASRLVDLHEVRTTLGLSQVRLATEDELRRLFPDCETGAMPALGPLYNIPVYLDGSLACQETIAFNAGTHAEMLQMAYGDFDRLVRPMIVSVAYRTRQTV